MTAVAPLFVQARKTSLLVGITAAETGEIVLKDLVDAYGNPLAMADFGTILYLTFDPGGDSEEIISVTNFTVNADGTVTLDTGISRGLSAKTPYSAGGTPTQHAAGITIVASNNPQLYNALVAYINSIAIAGAPNASLSTQGLLQLSTPAQVNSGAATGSTGAPLAVTPDSLAASSVGTNTPTVGEKQFLDSISGIPFPYMGDTAPAGFLMCDNSAYSNDTYPVLAGITKGRYGYGTGIVFTVNAATDVVTANSHGFVNGNRLLLDSTVTLPAGLSANTIYFVIAATTNTFKLATSAGGTAIDITGTGTGVHGAYNNFRVPDMRNMAIIGAGQRSHSRAYDSTIMAETDPAMGQVIAGVSPGTITVIAGNAITSSAAHGLTTGDPFYITGTPPSGLSASTLYFADVIDGTNFYACTTYANALAAVHITISGTTGAAIFPAGYFNSPKAQAGWVYNGITIALSTTTTAPTGLSAGNYFVWLNPNHPTRMYLASSLANANLNIPVLVTGVGAGIQTLIATLSTRALGAVLGEETHHLTIQEVPSHQHTVSVTSGNGPTSTGGGITLAAGLTGAVGSDTPHNNMQPSVAMNWIVKSA